MFSCAATPHVHFSSTRCFGLLAEASSSSLEASATVQFYGNVVGGEVDPLVLNTAT